MCTLVLSTHFFACPIRRANEVARWQNWASRKKFIYLWKTTETYSKLIIKTLISSRPEEFCEKVFLEISQIFTEKHMYQSIPFNKVAVLRPVFIEHFCWLLPDTRMTLTETVLLPFLLWTLDKFLFPGVFSKNIFVWKFRNFGGHMFICSVYSRNLKHCKKRPQQKILLFRSSRSQMFAKKIFLISS